MPRSVRAAAWWELPFGLSLSKAAEKAWPTTNADTYPLVVSLSSHGRARVPRSGTMASDMDTPQAELIACCVASYDHPAVRWVLGDSWHPGGLPLTTRLAEAAGVGTQSRVLDAGSGRGATAVHLAKTVGCRVVGVTLEPGGTAVADDLARHQGVEERTTFVQGDLMDAALEGERFDAVLMECVLSILSDKPAALRGLYGLLRPGGRIGLTDVTVSGALPDELQGLLAVVGCVGNARSLEEYGGLLAGAGFAVETAVDLPETATAFLKDLGGKLMLAEIAAKLGKLPVGGDVLVEAKRLLTAARDLVSRGALSYGMVVATKPEA